MIRMGLFSNLKEKKIQREQEKVQKERERVNQLLELAEKGNKEAQLNVGLYYAEWHYGKSELIQEDNHKAFEYLLRAAQKVSDDHDGRFGNNDAAFYVGKCYTNGLGTEKNYFEAISIFMSLIYIHKNNYFQHQSDCIKYLKKIRTDVMRNYNPNDIQSVYECAMSLYFGILPDDDVSYCKNLGMKYFKSASEAGHPDSFNVLASLYKDEPSVAEKYLIMAAENGNPTAQCKLGKRYYEQGELDESLFWYEKAAVQGNEMGQRYAGIICYKQRNNLKAEEWLNKATVWRANIDYAPTSLTYLLIGKIYQDKDGERHKNNIKALELYKKGMQLEEGLSTELMHDLGENSCTYAYDLLQRTMNSQPYRDIHNLDK